MQDVKNKLVILWYFTLLMDISAFHRTPHSNMWWFLVLSTFLMPLLYSSSSSDSSLSLLILLDLLMQKSDFHGYVEDLEQGQIKQKKKKESSHLSWMRELISTNYSCFKNNPHRTAYKRL